MARRPGGGGGCDVVTVDLTGHPRYAPLGMLLAPGAMSSSYSSSHSSPSMSNVTLVAGWEHSHGGDRVGCAGKDKKGRLGPIQLSGCVRLGDRLVRINGVDVTNWTFREVMDALREMVYPPSSSSSSYHYPPETNGNGSGGRNKTRLRTLGFAPSTIRNNGGNNDDDDIPIHDGQRHAHSIPSHVPIHANGRYSFTSYVGRWRVFENDDDDHVPPRPPPSTAPHKRVVRYEIVCQVLFRDITSLRSSSSAAAASGNGGLIGVNGDDVHRTWSVWRRYSELRLLDAQLRSVYGWQMNATNDGRGISFPGSRSIECWWLGLGGGGYGVNLGRERQSMMMSTSSSSVGTSEKNGMDAASCGDDGRGATRERRSCGDGDDEDDDDDDVGNDPSPPPIPHPSRSVGNCPLPPSFVDRRRRELASYWTELMRIEDIFDFGDLEYGKTMANFLGVDDGVLLLARKGIGGSSAATAATMTRQQKHSSSTTTSANNKDPPFPAIHEHEATDIFPGIPVGSSLEDPTYLARPPPESSGLISSLSPTNTGNIAREISGYTDDDVSILSDGTGTFQGDARATLRGASNHRFSVPVVAGRPVVDVVPAHYDDSGAVAEVAAVEEGGGAMQTSDRTEERHRIASSASAASSYANNRSVSRAGGSLRGIGVTPHRTKPAFQRQFL